MEVTEMKQLESASPGGAESAPEFAGAAIEVVDLAKVYPGEVPAVRGISFLT